jgi:hypothetical protein
VKLSLQHIALPGRLLLIGLSVLIWVGIISLFITIGYEETWKIWNIPTEMPAFMDFRLIPGTAETVRMGMDPTISNPGDPIGRLFNYPKVWYLIFYTGVSQNDTIWVVIPLIILFFISVFAFPGELKVLDVLLILCIIFSPAAMFLYERGNVDLIFFTLCASALLIMDFSAYTSLALVLMGAVFKIYPIFMMSVYLDQGKKRFWYLFLAGSLIFGAYTLLSWNDFRTDWKITQRGFDYSYGANVIILHFRHELNVFLLNTFSHGWTDRFLDFGPYIIAIIIFSIAVVLGVRSAVTSGAHNQRNLAAFRLGASIYIGTFLMGNNWDYRLVFLVFTLPQISEWARTRGERMRALAILNFVMMFIACWYLVIGLLLNNFGLLDVLKDPLFVLDEIAKWGMFMGLTILFFASAPEWLKSVGAFLPVARKPDNLDNMV